jgi:hypothetical protein
VAPFSLEVAGLVSPFHLRSYGPSVVAS